MNSYQVETEHHGVGRVFATTPVQAATIQIDKGGELVPCPVYRIPDHDTPTANAYARLLSDPDGDTWSELVWVSHF